MKKNKAGDDDREMVVKSAIFDFKGWGKPEEGEGGSHAGIWGGVGGRESLSKPPEHYCQSLGWGVGAP